MLHVTISSTTLYTYRYVPIQEFENLWGFGCLYLHVKSAYIEPVLAPDYRAELVTDQLSSPILGGLACYCYLNTCVYCILVK
jgi:hypothetical protein